MHGVNHLKCDALMRKKCLSFQMLVAMRKANSTLKLLKLISSNLFLSRVESKYKIINVKHHRRMKRSGEDTEVDSTINIKISDSKGKERRKIDLSH